MPSPPIKRALISVTDKYGVTEFAAGLVEAGVEIYSTGGTSKKLRDAGIEVVEISDYTEFPEMMDGRLKTLHPKTFGGILCRHDNPSDMAGLEAEDILTFELVVVNLYQFERAATDPDLTVADAIEKIDIGGPSLVRAAAKNHAFTTIATHPFQYGEILHQIKSEGATTHELRQRLAHEAFAHTAHYDTVIAKFFAEHTPEGDFPRKLNLELECKASLRYGENPHQRKAALYAERTPVGPNVVDAEKLHGKELSYNNLLDLDAALDIVLSFAQPAASVIKHSTPCGTAVGGTLEDALRKGMDGDPLSAFGCVIGLNRVMDAAAARVLTGEGMFVEAIIAPGFEPAAIEILTTQPTWKKSVRLMKVSDMSGPRQQWVYRPISGGVLRQEADVLEDPEDEWEVKTTAQPTDEQLEQLRFAWKVVRFVKSNAIAICKDGMLLGAGGGQTSRVDSTEIAIKKAGDRIQGSVLASDAFFPFPDSIHRAADAGVTAIIQTGGSKGDKKVIAACDQHNLPMIITGRRHFKH